MSRVMIDGHYIGTNSAEYIALMKAMEDDVDADTAFIDTDTRLVVLTAGATPAPPPAAVDADRGHRGPVGEGDGEAVLEPMADWLRALLTRCEVCDE